MNALVLNCSPVRNGATAEIVCLVHNSLDSRYTVRCVCIDDYDISFCRGCRTCHETAECVIQNDDMNKLMDEYEWADVIVQVSPSYWAELPGQFKAFIDRCTPWCNTHEPHAKLIGGKRGYNIVLRTGPHKKECERIIESMEHFYGHMEIDSRANMSLCSIENRDDVLKRKDEVIEFCNKI